eukprot:UN0624
MAGGPVRKRPASAAPPSSPPQKRARKSAAASGSLPMSVQPWYANYAGGSNDLYRKYMDYEWGVPIEGRGRSQDNKLFEVLSLEGAQAGLSWDTILKKREAYRRAFDGFDIQKVARYGPGKVTALLNSSAQGAESIVKNRAKIVSVLSNAKECLKVAEEFGSLSDYVWSFVGGRPRQNRWKQRQDIPNDTEDARLMSRDMKRRGFSFVGPTVCYSFMQSVGMVNDHVAGTAQWQRVHGIVERRFGASA